MNTHATEDFFAGCVNTHREIHEHKGKFRFSVSILKKMRREIRELTKKLKAHREMS